MTTMFFVIALVASGFLGIQILMLMFGADMEFDSDTDVDAGDGGGFLSIRSLTAFFGGFGWAGLAARQAGWSGPASIATGFAVGAGMFVVIGFLFMQARRLTSSGNVDYSSAVGSIGTVYIGIPAERKSGGKIEATASGRVSVVNAITDAESPIPARTRVEVVDVVDATTVLVRPI
jgi:hypothetical protein